MDTVPININIELVEKATPILQRYGIDIETALNVFLMQMINDVSRVSFDQGIKETVYKRPPFQFGCLRGLLEISDDFDDVLVVFEEYM